ncbi:Clavesin-2 like protein [Argiope bruennichi]|uniref:Clavesin-2 like protein n=2 Tax=Argiope bruennichi TaxID=94029 RepID=A0A8T0EQ84_ARGBR|nr:Clavesin-2 like protein [Argiope bruennichi]
MDNSSTKFLRFDAVDIDDPSVQVWQKEINETAENRASSLKILRRDLKSCTDIEPCLDETMLLSALRVTKFDTTKALRRIKNFYQKEEKLIDGFRKISMSYHKARSLRHFFISPYRLQDNSLLIMLSAGIDYNEYSLEERLYLECLATCMLVENPVNQICGLNLICDFAGFTFRGLREHTPWKLKWFMDSMLNTLPVRFKRFHIVNTPILFPPLYSIGCHFCPKKIQERIFIHPNDNWKSLHAHIPADILPEKYGGRLKDSSMLNCLEYFGLEKAEELFHKRLEYGFKKTKNRRLSFKVLY